MLIIIVTVIHNCNLGERKERKKSEAGRRQLEGRLIFNVDSNYSLYCQYYDTLVYSSRRGCQQGPLQRIIASRVSRVYRCSNYIWTVRFVEGLRIVFSENRVVILSRMCTEHHARQTGHSRNNNFSKGSPKHRFQKLNH